MTKKEKVDQEVSTEETSAPENQEQETQEQATEQEATEQTQEEAAQGEEATEKAQGEETQEESLDPTQALNEEIRKLKEENQELKNEMLRQRADLENFKKRKNQEAQERLKFASQGLVLELLPNLDNLERAIDHADSADDEKLKAFVEGMEMVKNQFFEALKKHHVERTHPVGEKFDPTKHEAVGMTQSEEVDNDHVAAVLQPGYSMHDRVIRPAMVQVCKK